jgi:cytochrome c oxidase cbb3-type subunit III
VLIGAAVLCAGNLVAGAQSEKPAGAQSPQTTAGEEIFATHCSGCHGLDGRGGERAPNIVQDRAVQRLTDDDLERIIRQGIIGTGMPAFRSLGDSGIRSVVAYLRTLQGTGKVSELPGDPEHGKRLFFEKAGCSACHMMSGVGGFIGSDLSGFAHTHSVEEIRSAIVKPNPNGDRQALMALATTLKGEKYKGRVRNEDNFSVQLQTLDGAFHFLAKSSLENLEYTSQPIMPSDYESSLSVDELNDILSYLMKTAGPSKLEKSTEKDIEHEEETVTDHPQ